MGDRVHCRRGFDTEQLTMCLPTPKTPYTPQMPQAPDQGQVNAQLTRMSGSPLGVASTVLTSPNGVAAPAATAPKVLIGS
jgi:hypothetical protein